MSWVRHVDRWVKCMESGSNVTPSIPQCCYTLLGAGDGKYKQISPFVCCLFTTTCMDMVAWYFSPPCCLLIIMWHDRSKFINNKYLCYTHTFILCCLCTIIHSLTISVWICTVLHNWDPPPHMHHTVTHAAHIHHGFSCELFWSVLEGVIVQTSYDLFHITLHIYQYNFIMDTAWVDLYRQIHLNL